MHDCELIVSDAPIIKMIVYKDKPIIFFCVMANIIMYTSLSIKHKFSYSF